MQSPIGDDFVECCEVRPHGEVDVRGKEADEIADEILSHIRATEGLKPGESIAGIVGVPSFELVWMFGQDSAGHSMRDELNIPKSFLILSPPIGFVARVVTLTPPPRPLRTSLFSRRDFQSECGPFGAFAGTQVLALQGRSGTGKGTTVAKLKAPFTPHIEMT